MTALGFPASASGRGFFPCGEGWTAGAIRKKRRASQVLGLLR